MTAPQPSNQQIQQVATVQQQHQHHQQKPPAPQNQAPTPPVRASSPRTKEPMSPSSILRDPAIVSMSKPPSNIIPSVVETTIRTRAVATETENREPKSQQQVQFQSSNQSTSLPPKPSNQQRNRQTQVSALAPVGPVPVTAPSQPAKPMFATGPFLAPPHLSMAPESATEEEEIDFAEFTAHSLGMTPTTQAGVIKGKGSSGRRTGGTVPSLDVARRPTGSGSGTSRGTVTGSVGKKAGIQTQNKAQGRGKGPEKGSRRHEGQSPPRRRRKDRNEWANEDAEDIIQEDDFDIQGSLRLFDKKEVFSEIRESDMTDPETLLVSHNRLKPTSAPGSSGNPNSSQSSSSAATPPQAYYHHYVPTQPKLGIREPVLDIPPSGDETGNDAEVESELESDAVGVFEGEDDFFDETTPIANEPMSLIGRRRPVFSSAYGVPVPSVTPKEMVEVERVAGAETGPNEEQMVENGGRGVAGFVLQVVGGGRRIKPGNHNAAPIVVVLAGNNKTGAYGLCAARHLANHDVNVMVCTVGNEAEQSNTVAYQRKIYLPTGGQIVRGIAELPLQTVQPVDLIIDALLGPHNTILDIPLETDRNFVCDLMKWANDNKANVLSLDMPSGISGVTGQPTSPSHYINAKWTVSFGLPKTGLSKEFAGEIFLADIGIPKIVFQKMGRVGPGGSGTLAAAVGMARIKYIPPFGEKFLVGLTLEDEGDQ
ncbi:enhancer of mRNA decapping [Phlyctochytrium planicorne]|nr:enhancer of mRNA decapping [Phlyctochytrium planicorne]